MEVVGRSDRRAVERVIADGRDLREGSGPWTCRFLDRADVQFGGAWWHVTLPAESALAIVLPAHAGEPCRGDRRVLSAAGGARVGAVAAELAAMSTSYAADNPTCWTRISAAMDAPFSPIILTTAPLTLAEYADIVPAAACLYHLDGFHRLIGWALHGRLAPPSRLHAYVAGPIDAVAH